MTQEEYSDTYLRRFKNLRKFRKDGSGEGGQWTDEEIRTYLRNRPPKKSKEDYEDRFTLPVPPDERGSEVEDREEYERLFKIKMKSLQKEYGVDLNDANDAESLRTLVRLSLQQEAVDEQIRKASSSKVINTKSLKDLGDYQRGLQMSIQSLQQELGISRKARKEKNVDDLPKYIAQLQDKAADFWDRKTKPIRCPKDQIELARIWINFPRLNNHYQLEFECYKCHEVVIDAD